MEFGLLHIELNRKAPRFGLPLHSENIANLTRLIDALAPAVDSFAAKPMEPVGKVQLPTSNVPGNKHFISFSQFFSLRTS